VRTGDPAPDPLAGMMNAAGARWERLQPESGNCSRQDAKTPRRNKGAAQHPERPLGEPNHFDNTLKFLGELGALA